MGGSSMQTDEKGGANVDGGTQVPPVGPLLRRRQRHAGHSRSLFTCRLPEAANP